MPEPETRYELREADGTTKPAVGYWSVMGARSGALLVSGESVLLRPGDQLLRYEGRQSRPVIAAQGY